MTRRALGCLLVLLLLLPFAASAHKESDAYLTLSTDPARPTVLHGQFDIALRDLAFVLPIVGSTVSDYLPAPHNPGLFEVPVDADLPTGVPSVFRKGVRYTGEVLKKKAGKTGAK